MWYRITNKILLEYKGLSLLQKHRSHVYFVLQDVFPEFEWHPWKFVQIPKFLWVEKKYILMFLTYMSRCLGLLHMEDWYGVTVRTINAFCGSTLLSLYKGHHYYLLKSIYPEYTWHAWLFKTCPCRLWDSLEERRNYFSWLGKKLDIIHLDSWYKVPLSTLESNHGGTILRREGQGHLYFILKEVYPNWDWKAWKFPQVPENFWCERENRKSYIRFIEEQLLNSPPNPTCNPNRQSHPNLWKNFTTITFRKIYGHHLMKFYRTSLYHLLKDNLPNFDVEPWEWSIIPRYTFDDLDVLRKYISSLEKKLNIRVLNDWYRISRALLIKNHGNTLVKKYGLARALTLIYPEHPWDVLRFKRERRKKARQRILATRIGEIWPRESIYEDFKHLQLFWPRE
eukprot:TRINITY_DN15033_c0_g2_i2.p1 TRINITY_DN15033_c0_g2~~TRINITY_DN15033_c0_g2_i2.p1  ORF type:complete len:396 (+),score=70.34 TRINITY_DN15033_c0_g2_i2:1179-2366(+)